MPTPPPAPSSKLAKPRTRVSPVWFQYCLAVLGICVAIALIGFSIWRWRLYREVNARVAAIRAQGLPADWDDLARWPSVVPDSENAALIYTNALAHLHLKYLTNRPVELPERGELLPSTNLSQIRNIVEANREGLEIIYSADKFSKSRYPIDYTNLIRAQLPHLTGLRSAARLLGYEALLKSEAGDADGASKAVIASLRLAESLENEPLLMSQLVAASTEQDSCKSLERVICRIPLPEQALLELSKQLAAADATNRILTGMIGERAMSAEYMRLLNSDLRKAIIVGNQGQKDVDKQEVPSRNPGVAWRYLGFFERDRNFFLRAMETNLLIVATPPPTSLSMTNEIERMQKQAEGGYYILSSLLLPSISRMPVRVATTYATIRTGLAAVAVERWRNQHDGIIPDSLDALVPAYLSSVPIDPYNGQPLKFKKLSKGYVVYSVGPDLHDDGGKPQPPRSAKKRRDQPEHYDITFTVER